MMFLAALLFASSVVLAQPLTVEVSGAVLVGGVAALAIGLLQWLARRSVDALDARARDHERRIRELELQFARFQGAQEDVP